MSMNRPRRIKYVVQTDEKWIRILRIINFLPTMKNVWKNIGEKTISVFKWKRMKIFNWLFRELWIMHVHVLILLQRVKVILHTYIKSWYVILFASEMLQSEDCLFYFYLNLVYCFVCEVQSSDIVSSVCQTVNIDCAIND